MDISSFKKIKSLGLGATSEVFWAINLKTNENIALKVFNPIIFQDEDALSRLKNEVESLEKLKHPNIVTLFAEHSESQFYALELELVDGQDLKNWRKNYDLVLIEPLIWILAQVARALGAAHELEILHRDLKPENILISKEGDVKITDFGLARQLDRLTMTRLGLLTGSLGYMAPEIINGARATAQSDIFSFGVIAYEILASSSPFLGETPQALLKSVVEMEEEPLHHKNPLVPLRISNLIKKCLSKDPKERPETIWNVEAELLSYIATTRLLPFCKEIVSEGGRAKKFPEALTLKNKQLHRTIDSLDSRSKSNQQRLLELARELMGLFPEDKKASELLESLTTTHEAKTKKWVGASLLALFLLAFIFMGKHFKDTLPKEASVPTQTPNIKSTSPLTAPPVLTGLVRFIADPDVAIYVDHHRLLPKFWPAFQTNIGPHEVKMVKEGFLPLIQKIQVEGNHLVTINTKGNAK